MDISDRLVAYWNTQRGVKFLCGELSYCSCSDVDDWDTRSQTFELGHFQEGQPVLVSWREACSDRDSTLQGVVHKAERRLLERSEETRVRSVSGCDRALEAGPWRQAAHALGGGASAGRGDRLM